ncbi:MAG: transcriptional regulator [Gammaproteobacteria bacterium]|nr:MAG: transcriptional regulator [Gammaproteobacteria bacterium]
MSDIENITKSIGMTIRIRRKQLGMTQLDLAEIAGLQRQTIGRVENGNEAVTVATVARVAAAVGLDLMVMPRYADGRS